MPRRYLLNQEAALSHRSTPVPSRIARRAALVTAAALLATTRALADSISIGATLHEDVYISESPKLYYVSQPDVGKTFSVPKDDPAVGHVDITPNPDVRDEIYERYREARELLRESEATDTAHGLGDANRIESTFSESDVTDVRATWDVSTRAAPLLELRGPPRPFVVAIPAGGRAAGPSFGSNAGRPRGGGAANFGAGGGGSGAAAGGGGGARGGGRGGGAGGGQNGASSGFTNISELFDTIDDAEVGETPNPIALGRSSNF